MDNFTDIPHIYSPLLYIFEGELIRIGRFIKEVLQHVRVFPGYGELYGLYTHSHGAVVHVTTLKNLNQRQLQDAMSSRIEATGNEYSLNLIGEWLTVQNQNISVRELLRKKADTLNESETYFFIVVEKVQTKFNFEDISKFTKTFFLTKGKIYKMDMKILKRESPFRLDFDFIEKISSAGYIGDLSEKCNGVEIERLCLNGLENVGTELKEMSSGISKLDTAPLNSENPHDRNENGLPVLQNESGIKESEDTRVENKTEESSDVLKAKPVLPMKETSIEANSTGVMGNTKEIGGELEARDRAGQTEVPVEHSTKDDDAWVDIKSNDVLNAKPDSPTEEVPIQAICLGDEKNRIYHKEADSLDGKQGKTGFDSSVVEKSSTFENEDNIVCDDIAQQSEENDNKESEEIKVEDSQVANEESLSREEDSANTVLPDVERKTVKTKDGTDSLTEGQEEMNCSPAEHSGLTEIEGNITKNGGELGTVDRGQGETDSDDSMPVKNLTGDKIENGNNIIHSGPQQSEENDMRECEGIMSEDGKVANEESLPSEEDFATTVSPDEEKKITENEGEIDSVAEGQGGMNCAAEGKSTGKDKIENGDDVGREAEKFQDIENGGRHDKKSGEFERVTAENETKLEHKGNSVTEYENKDGKNSKSQETENGENDEFDMGTLENSLSTKEHSNNHDKLDNEQQKSSLESTEEENLSQEGAFDDTSVIEVDNKTSKNEHVVDKKQSEQNNFPSVAERQDNSSFPSVENQLRYKDCGSEKKNETCRLDTALEIELD